MKDNQKNIFDDEQQIVSNLTDDGTEIIPFHDFSTEKMLKAMLIRDYHYDGGDGADAFDAYVVKTSEGQLRLIPQSYAIERAVKDGYGHVFTITYTGTKTLGQGRKVHTYDILKSLRRDEDVYKQSQDAVTKALNKKTDKKKK